MHANLAAEIPHDDAPAETRAERRMRRLEQLSEVGVSMAKRLDRQSAVAATLADTDAVPNNLPHVESLGDLSRAFAQVCRAVSVATALEDRIDKGLPALPEVDRARRLREEAADAKRGEVFAAIEHALSCRPETGRRRLVDLKLDLDRLLDRETADLDRFLARPMAEVVARLRLNLGLGPEDEDGLWIDSPPLQQSCGGGGVATDSGRQASEISDVIAALSIIEPLLRPNPSPSAAEPVVSPSAAPSAASRSPAPALAGEERKPSPWEHQFGPPKRRRDGTAPFRSSG